MSQRRRTVHCELGPVLVNRTAVYRMCVAASHELQSRGFEVQASALLARLNDRAEPSDLIETQRFEESKAWLHHAVHQPSWFLKRGCYRRGLQIQAIHRGDVRLFFDPFYTLFYPTITRGVVIVYDISCVTDPDWHPGGVGQLYQTAFNRLAKNDFHIIASCQNTADQLWMNWGILPSRISVIHLGLFSEFEGEQEKVPNQKANYLLFVGSLEDRKNICGLIQGYSRSRVFESFGTKLRLIGNPNHEDHPIRRLASTTPGVEVVGFAADEEIQRSYAECLGFVFPSFCEGFGLPLLEAMSHGCVCLSTICGASPEIAQDGTLSVDPFDIDAIASSIRKIVTLTPHERMQFESRSREIAGRFKWSHFYDRLAVCLNHQLTDLSSPRNIGS